MAASSSSSSSSSSSLVIHSAVYGHHGPPEEVFDVTDKVRGFVSNNELVIEGSHNDKFSDPYPNIFKFLRVEYSWGADGDKQTVEVPENGVVRLSPPRSAIWDENPAVFEWDTAGYWEPSIVLPPTGYRIVFTEPRDTSAPFMHFKRLNLYDENGAQFSYRASSDAPLKKSVNQTAEMAQSPTEGKYRASRITEVPVTRTKWAPVRPTPETPVVLEIAPPEGQTSLPFLGGYEFVHGIRTSRYPHSWKIYELHGTSSVEIHSVHHCSVGGVDFNIESRINMDTSKIQRSSYKGSAQLLATIAGGDEAACVRALNHGMGPFWNNGQCTNSEAIMQAVVATRSPRLLCLFFASLNHSSPEIEKAVFASGDEALIRAFVRSQPAKLGFFKAALQQRSDSLFDFLAGLFADLLRDESNANRVLAWSAQNSKLLSHVVHKLTQLKTGQAGDLGLPDHPVVADPTTRLLAAAYEGPDRDFFNILFGLASKPTIAVFVEKMVAKNRASVALLQQTLDRGVHLGHLLPGALENKNLEVAALLLSSGYSLGKGNDSALFDAFQARDTDTFDLLVSFGTPAPYFHLFNTLLADDNKSTDYRPALDILFKPGRLHPDAVTPAGVSLVERAVKKNNFELVAALLAAGASKTLPSGESLFGLVVDAVKTGDVLLTVLPMATEADRAKVSTALIKYVKLRGADDGAEAWLAAVKQFLAAGADINAVVDDESALSAAVKQHWSRDFFDGLVALGADPAKSPNLVAAAAASGASLSEADFEHLSGLQPFDAVGVIYSLLEARPTVLAEPSSAALFKSALAKASPEELAVPRRLRHTSGPGAGELREVPLLLASLLFQQDNAVFDLLVDTGLRLPSEFSDPDFAQRIKMAMLCALIRGTGKLDVNKASEIFDRFEHSSISHEEYVAFILNAGTLGVDLFSHLDVEFFQQLIDREDFDANRPLEDYCGSFLVQVIRCAAPVSLLETLLRSGASVEGAEEYVWEGKRIGSLLALAAVSYTEKYDSDKPSPVDAIKALLEHGCSWQSKDPDNLPAPHSIAFWSGKVSERPKRAQIKLILAELLRAGMPINMPLGDFAAVTVALPSYCSFDNATPMDMNYAGNEYLQRWFRKREGVRGTR